MGWLGINSATPFLLINMLTKVTMLKKILLAASMIFILFIVQANGQLAYQAPLEKNLIVSTIYVKGVKKVISLEIKNKLKTKETAHWPWSKSSYFNKDMFDEDLQQVVNFYEDRGFYDTKVVPEFKVTADKKLYLTLNITEGYRIKIAKIDILNDAHLSSELKKLLYASLEINEKDYFSYQDYDVSKNNILSVLADNGYYEAQVSGVVYIDREKKQAVIAYTLQTGPKQNFGRNIVTGNTKVREGIITRELVYKGDQTFNASKLYESQRRIFDLGFFRSVILEPVPNPKNPSVLDIKLEVEERPFYTLKIGPGYGPVELARIQAFWKLLNFGRLGGNLEINGKLAVKTHLLDTSYTQPYFSDRYTSFLGGLNYEKVFLNFYNREQVSARARILRNLTPTLSAFSGYQIERDLLFPTDPGFTFDESTGFDRRYVLSFLQIGFQHKTTEDIFSPKRGQIDSFTWEFTPKYLGSSASFLRGLWEYKYYYPVSKYIVLAWRNQFGYARAILGSSSVPVFKRFYSGGSYSVRGYSDRSLGPRDEHDNPIGGNSQWEGNIELRFPFYRDFGGALFYDYGEIFPQTKHYALNQLKTTVGFGLRYDTRIGPLRFDYGYKLRPYQGTDRYKIYVSIGQAF